MVCDRGTWRAWSWLATLVVVLAGLVGCGGAAAGGADATACGTDATAPARWVCPAAWVVAAVGGCGPAVLLCVPDGGAAPGACADVDLARRPMVTLPDGGTVRGFYRLPDGGLGGAWPEPGDPTGPPAADWTPDAGIATCPAGWPRLADGTCDPALRGDCPTGSEALPGGACTPTSAADCPAGEYADLGPEATGATVVHVRAGADPATADGSTTHPYATVADGVLHAGTGGWVRVAAGTYTERLVVGAGAVHVVGVCTARVTLRGPGPEGAAGATVAVTGAGVTLELRTLTVTGAGRGLQAAGGAQVRATAVRLTDNAEYAVVASDRDTTVTLAASVAAVTHPRADATAGNGLVALAGATLVATSVAVTGNADVGVRSDGAGTVVTLATSVVRATHPHPDGTGGEGLTAAGGAALRATGAVVADNTEVGILASGGGTHVEVTASVVRATRPHLDGTGGNGLAATTGAVLRATDVDVADNAEAGIAAQGVGTQVELTSSVVRSTRTRPDGTLGLGMEANSGASLRASGVVVAGNAEAGILASNPGTTVEVTASVVRGTHPRPDGTVGHGLEANSGAALRASGVVVTDNAEAGVVAQGAGTQVELTASSVRTTLPSPGGTLGNGIVAQAGAVLRATGMDIANNAAAGVVAQGAGTQVELTASVVLSNCNRFIGGIRPDVLDGFGLAATTGAVLHATGVNIAANAVAGVVAEGAGTQVELTASSVRGTQPSSAGTFGRGLEANSGASLRATSTLVADNVEAGVSVFGGSAQLTDVLVAGVAPSARGLGVGLLAAQGAQVDGTRVALQAVGGAGVAVVPGQGVAGTRVTARDLVVRGVRPSTVRFSEDSHTVRPEGSSVAYGLHAGAGCTVDVTRAVVADGGFGFFNASGTVAVHTGVIAGQFDAAGAVDLATPDRATTLADVTFGGNACNGFVRRSDLPTASALPPPTPSM